MKEQYLAAQTYVYVMHGPVSLRRACVAETAADAVAIRDALNSRAAIEDALAIFEKAFEDGWVVQDTIDAIRSVLKPGPVW